jgi:hypothetical protein
MDLDPHVDRQVLHQLPAEPARRGRIKRPRPGREGAAIVHRPTVTVPSPAFRSNWVTPPAYRTRVGEQFRHHHQHRVHGVAAVRRDHQQKPAGHISGLPSRPHADLVERFEAFLRWMHRHGLTATITRTGRELGSTQSCLDHGKGRRRRHDPIDRETRVAE